MTKGDATRLGDRLRADAPPSREDAALLEQYVSHYAEPLDTVQIRLVASDFTLQAGRIKSRLSIVEKLKRSRKMRLPQMQDIVGARIVEDVTLDAQTDRVRQARRLFDVITEDDRRKKPSHGYRAVHLIVGVDGWPVEIQFRTTLQNLWAQTVERLADSWGRQIRYGEEPDDPDLPAAAGESKTRFMVISALHQLSSIIASREALEEGLEVPDEPEDRAVFEDLKATIDSLDKDLRGQLRALAALVGGES